MTPEEIKLASGMICDLDRLTSVKENSVSRIIDICTQQTFQEMRLYSDIPRETISEYFMGLELILSDHLDKKIKDMKIQLQELGVNFPETECNEDIEKSPIEK